VKKHPDAAKEDIAASFQDAVIDVLISRSIHIAHEERIHTIVCSGGVSANSALRGKLSEKMKESALQLYLPSLPYCTDNAAMIAAAGYHQFRKGHSTDYTLNPKSVLPLGSANG